MAGILESAKQIPAGTEQNYISRGRKQLGPAWIYISKRGERNGTALAGTADATASATITGTGTAWDATLVAGDFIAFGSLAGQTFKVKTVTSATSITLYTTITVVSDTVTRVSLIKLGCTDATIFNFGLVKGELKCSQEGSTRADKSIIGYTCSVEVGLAEQTPEIFAKVTQGIQNILDTSTGAIKGQAFGVPFGQTDSEVAVSVYLALIGGLGAESDQEADILTILKAASTPDTQITRDAETQIFYKTMFEGYLDQSTKLNGVPLVWHMGPLS